MDCAKCSTKLPENAKFCNACGTSTEAAPDATPNEQTVVVEKEESTPACATCGAALLPNAKFCAKCGTVAARSGAVDEPTLVQGSTRQPPGKGVSPAPEAPTARFEAAAPPRQPHASGHMARAGAAPGYAGRDWVTDGMRYIQRVLTFDATVYSELRADPQATAFSVVAAALGMFAFGLGGFLWTAIEFDGDWEVFWKSALVGTLLGLLFWLGWVAVVVVVLTNAFRQTVRFDEVLRVLGAATATLALGILMFIPGITFGIALLVVALWVATSIFALQTAFQLEPRQAVAANIAGFAVWALILPLIVTAGNPLGPGIFLFDWSKDVVVDIYAAYSPLNR